MQTKFLLTLSICATIFFSWITLVELRPFIRGNIDQRARLQSQINGYAQPGLSSYTQKLALNDCLEATTSLSGRLLPTEERIAVLNHCLRQTKDITQIAPSNSFAWFTQALISSLKLDTIEFNRSLYMSRITGPNEQWIAELRVDLAENQFAKLNVRNLAAHSHDLQLLLTSPRGIKSIAHRYLNKQNFKQRIIVVLEQMDEKTQSQFVRHVHSEARAQGLL